MDGVPLGLGTIQSPVVSHCGPHWCGCLGYPDFRVTRWVRLDIRA